MTQADSAEFYSEHKGQPFFAGLNEFTTSDVVVGMELVSDNAIQKWR
jgi:nucleoside-diphosphate kinase